MSFPVAREDLDPLERVHGKTAAQIAHLSARSIKAAAEKLGLLDSMQARVNFDKMSDEEKATLLFLAVTGQPPDPLLKEMDLAMDDVRGTCIGRPSPGALCQYGLSALSVIERRLVLVPIEASEKYCSNDCPWAEWAMSGNAFCKLFEGRLVWDKRKKENGLKRLQECRDKERRA